MLTRMQSNWASPTFLLGMQNGPATLEDKLGVSYKNKHALNIHI